MDESDTNTNGYVYVLAVKDIELPVCKIGRTSRDPYERCSEINKSSTGDFIWEVAFKISVNDCMKLESLVHEKLGPIRQKRREFFNIKPDDAYHAIQSIMKSAHDIQEITLRTATSSQTPVSHVIKRKPQQKRPFRKIDSTYTEILQSFTSLLNIKGRPFGQLNNPVFGISDGNDGVQWNIAIYPETNDVRIGINLEGMKYSGWPITNFISSELANPTITDLIRKLTEPELIFLRFVRDAWQVTARPPIVEQYLNGEENSLSHIDNEDWIYTLEQALLCLDKEKNYRGRNRQMVTLVKIPKNGERKKIMEVSPHLNIWTKAEVKENISDGLEKAHARLRPVHQWVSRLSQT